MSVEWIRQLWRSQRSRRSGDPAPVLPLLTHLRDLQAADWLRAALATFATSVASFLPGHLPAYARLYHPFDLGGNSPVAATSWRELAALAGRELTERAVGEDFALNGVPYGQAPVGTLPPALIDVLVEHLRPATATPEACYFAVWEGFGASAVPPTLTPRLELPHRAYHVFTGPIAAARTSYSAVPWHHQSANLWWPADRAWCVATEVDFGWTYVGAPRACIDAVLADPRLEAVETSARARW